MRERWLLFYPKLSKLAILSPMREYDVVIIGAGPAGGQCARQLARQNRKVLIVDRVTDFSQNNFSSAGSPLETLSDFDLPETTVAAYWTDIYCRTKNFAAVWKENKPLGVVFDFKKLREFLLQDAQKSGEVEILLGHTFFQVHRNGGPSEVSLKNVANGEVTSVLTKVLVDATGPARAVIYTPEEHQPEYRSAVGVEDLIETDTDTADRLGKNRLTFFLGRWCVPGGYGWVFPMGSNLFKIGAGWFRPGNRTGAKNLGEYLDILIKEILKIEGFKVLDRHGSTLKITALRNERFYRENVVAVGDACSSVNWLGGEGIRHGLHSGNIAALTIGEYLDGKIKDFKPYRKRMLKYFGWRWPLSKLFSRLVYSKLSEKQLDRLFWLCSSLSAGELTKILFNYDFRLGTLAILRTLTRPFRR